MNTLIRVFRACCIALGLVTLSACAGIDPAKYAAEKPALDMRQYFNGTIDGYGMVRNRSGEVTRRFVVVIKASWAGEVLTLDEDFVWSDGQKEKRIWTIQRRTDGTWSGKAAGVVGEATGKLSGNAFNFRYTFDLPVGDKRYEVNFDDWLYLIDERHMLNHAQISKFGFNVADVFISFSKRPPGQ
jgi:hypothetical protein